MFLQFYAISQFTRRPAASPPKNNGARQPLFGEGILGLFYGIVGSLILVFGPVHLPTRRYNECGVYYVILFVLN